MAISQQELEQPAKVYQLQAVESQLKIAIEKLDTIVKQTSGLVTSTQHKEDLIELENRVTCQISDCLKDSTRHTDEEIEKINLNYSPIKYWVKWGIATVIIAILAVVGNIITDFIRRGS